jgi:hypothetical protein
MAFVDPSKCFEFNISTSLLGGYKSYTTDAVTVYICMISPNLRSGRVFSFAPS